jgi:hypothetical protein
MADDSTWLYRGRGGGGNVRGPGQTSAIGFKTLVALEFIAPSIIYQHVLSFGDVIDN